MGWLESGAQPKFFLERVLMRIPLFRLLVLHQRLGCENLTYNFAPMLLE
jgi:hypothetical protein